MLLVRLNVARDAGEWDRRTRDAAADRRGPGGGHTLWTLKPKTRGTYLDVEGGGRSSRYVWKKRWGKVVPKKAPSM